MFKKFKAFFSGKDELLVEKNTQKVGSISLLTAEKVFNLLLLPDSLESKKEVIKRLYFNEGKYVLQKIKVLENKIKDEKQIIELLNQIKPISFEVFQKNHSCAAGNIPNSDEEMKQKYQEYLNK